jgi:hypothetical protein
MEPIQNPPLIWQHHGREIITIRARKVRKKYKEITTGIKKRR